jgi:sec-independent protein translocase protein TatC
MSDVSFDREMTILEHLRELRTRLIITGIAVLIGMAIAAFFLTWPVISLLSEPAGLKLVALRPTETFVTYFKVALITGACLAMPVIVWQALLFVLPALHRHERRWVFVAVPFITLAFAAGLAFGFFVVIPFAVRYLMAFGGDVIAPFWSIEEYLTFITTMLFWIGLSFETPIVIFVLAKLHLVDARSLGRFRRYAIVGAFVIGAIVTPTPDPFNQTIVAVPIYLLFELGVLLARFA